MKSDIFLILNIAISEMNNAKLHRINRIQDIKKYFQFMKQLSNNNFVNADLFV